MKCLQTALPCLIDNSSSDYSSKTLILVIMSSNVLRTISIFEFAVGVLPVTLPKRNTQMTSTLFVIIGIFTEIDMGLVGSLTYIGCWLCKLS